MLQADQRLRVLLLLGALSTSLVASQCAGDVCEDASADETSLIQGLLEPDFVLKAQMKDDLQTPKVTTTEKPVVKGTKIKANMKGDLPAFFAAVRFDVMLFLLFVVTFIFLHRWYPEMLGFRDPINYQGDEFKPAAPTWFAWAGKGFTVSIDTISYNSGLDAAMLIRYSDLAIELMLVFGIPSCIILIPINAFAGGGFAKEDRLSWQGIGNVVWNSTSQSGTPLSKHDEAQLPDVQWIFWVVALAVWFVVIYTQRRLYTCQRDFIVRRMSWLTRMHSPRCTTILVEGIPEEHRTDEKFKSYFQTLFPDSVIQNAFVVKNLSGTEIPGLIAEYEDNLLAQKAAEGGGSDAPKEVNVEQLKSEAQALRTKIAQSQDEMRKNPEYASNGFVTFSKRTETERALGLKMSASEEEWVLSVPPDPEDVRYHDFEVGENTSDFEQKLGYAAIAGLFFIFMPIVVGISNLAIMIEHTPWIKSIVVATGFQATVQGVLSTVGLTVMMSMLPTFLMWIFKLFYTLKADRWAQIELQEYYFWFLVIFVLLITAIGTNLQATLVKVTESPLAAFRMLAAQMPVTTHFYLNYCMFQPVTHSMNLTRYIQFIKYLGFKRMYDEDTARQMAEPEDQDYYGTGSRSARFTMMLLIGIIFGTICPLINVVVLFNFLVCRCFYGYLINFVETKKTDQGGPHWYMQTVHTHLGLLIYIVMMTGVLFQRAEGKGPGIISAISFLWWFISYRKYKKSLHWESLPYVKCVEEAKNKKSENATGRKYCQRELEPLDSIVKKF